VETQSIVAKGERGKKERGLGLFVDD